MGDRAAQLESLVEQLAVAEKNAARLKRLALEAESVVVRQRWLLREAVLEAWLAHGDIRLTPDLYRVVSEGDDGPMADVFVAQGFARGRPGTTRGWLDLTEAGEAARLGDLVSAIYEYGLSVRSSE